MLSRLLANVVSGATVGYITNDLAIKMLFEKKFGLGGVIIDTRNQFVEKISQLVEREIINHKTLGAELYEKEESFQAALHKTVSEFLGVYLFGKVSPSFQVGDVPYIRLTTDYLKHQTKHTLSDTLPLLIDFTGNKIYLQDIFSEKQVAHLTVQVSKILTQILKDEDLLMTTLLQFYKDFREVPFNQLVTEDFWQQITNNTANLSADLHIVLKQKFDKQIDKLIRDIIYLLQTDDLIEQLSREVSQKKIHELLGLHYTNALSEEFLKRINDIVSSPEGNELLHNFADFIIKTLEQEQSTIFDLLSDNLAQSSRDFLRDKLPAIINSLIVWVQERRFKLEELIDQTFKGNVPSGLKTMVFNLFVNSISQSADVVKQIVILLETYQKTPAETAEKLTEKVIEFLQGNKIGSIVKRIKDNAKGMNLHDILVAGLIHGLRQIKTDEIAVFFEKRIGELVSKAEIADFMRNGLQQLVNNSLKNKTLYDEKFSALVAEQLKQQMMTLGEKSLGQLVDEQRFTKFAKELSGQLVTASQQNSSKISLYLYDTFHAQIENKLVGDVVADRWKGFLVDKLYLNTENILVKEIDEALKTPLEHLRFYASKQSNVATLYLKDLIMNNLEGITKGKIEDIIANRLHKMDDTALKNVVEKFMGEELKPITVLGAWLGGMAGGALYYLPTPANPMAYAALAALAYGITGWGTNWQAIKMVFRPHEPVFIGGRQVPFTPSILAKNQARFAGNMGNFVANHLLNEEILRVSFEVNKQKTYTAIYKALSKDHYAIIQQLIDENKHKIADFISQAAIDYLLPPTVAGKEANELKWQQALHTLLNNQQSLNLQDIDTQRIEQKISDFTYEDTFRKNVVEQVGIGLQRFANREKTVAEVIPTNIQQNIKTLLNVWVNDKVGELFDYVRSADRQADVITKLEPQFMKYKRFSLDKYLEDTQKTAIMLNVSKFIHERLIDTEIRNLLFNFVDVKLAQELSPDRKINELLNGRLMVMLNDNLDFLVDNVMEMGMLWLKSNKKEIADDVYKMALRKNPASFFYQSTIKDTVLDLAENGIPKFFADERRSLHDLLAVQAQTIGMSKLSELNIELDKTYLKELLETFLAREEMLLSVQNLSYSILKELFKVPVSVFLKVAGVANMRDLQRIMSHELNIVTRHIQQQGKEQQEEIGEKLSRFVNDVLDDKLRNTYIKDVFAKIDEETYKATADKLVQQFLQSATFEQQKMQFIQRFFAEVKRQKINQLVDIEALENDIVRTLSKLFADPATQAFLRTEIHRLSTHFLGNLPSHISVETKEFLTKELIEATIAALDNNISALINSVDLKKVVVEKIKTMHPSEIEKLFYSFADTYFTKLINYGFGFGIAFGLTAEAALYYGFKAVGIGQ
jgi:uncharacterized membrane protein YheB (UPF0754 family)